MPTGAETLKMFNVIVLKGNVTDETANTRIVQQSQKATHKQYAKTWTTSNLKAIQIRLNLTSLPLKMCQSMHHFILVFSALYIQTLHFVITMDTNNPRDHHRADYVAIFWGRSSRCAR